ncbi:hypothetical protein ACFXDH_10195 [Streptomyces sp. NPDC059467]|uniref:hypothetical protein n=1 Tax=Streptomyces sp. NPDC059467 TaxID=3346844 RepID=UPI0036A9B920
MAKRKKCPEEFNGDAVDLVWSSTDRSLTDIAHDISEKNGKLVSTTTVYNGDATTVIPPDGGSPGPPAPPRPAAPANSAITPPRPR